MHEEEYAIRFPVKRRRSELSKPGAGILAEQEKDDFHLALKLQQEETESESELESCYNNVQTKDGVRRDEELQIEEDAAAALLVLKTRKWLKTTVILQ